VILKDKVSGQNITSDWSKIKHGVPQGSVLGPLLCLLYMKDFPSAINKLSTPILFADDTSLVITNRNSDNIDTNRRYEFSIGWFKSNLLSINFFKNLLYAIQNKKYSIT
jgi:hypothetical protein